jgi:hypothetical protein
MSVTRLTPTPSPTANHEIINLSLEPETGFERIRRLQAEARSLAREQVEAACRDLAELAERCAEIAAGGEAFPAGVREMASRLAVDLPDRAQGMLIIARRIGG